MLHLEREARDWSTHNEYSYRIKLLLLLCIYCSRAYPHISLIRFEGVAGRVLFTSSANTPKTWWEGFFCFFFNPPAEGCKIKRKVGRKLTFFAEGK